MGSPRPSDVTRLLDGFASGDDEAQAALLHVVYDELRALARAHLRAEVDGHTLQPTALVHEAYLKLVQQRVPHWSGRAHFFGIAAQAMRRILVDHARRRSAAKRGGGRAVTLIDGLAAREGPGVDVVALDKALAELERTDPRAARIVEMRFFAGLEIAEVAQAIGVSEPTVKRDWRHAKAWLYRHLSEDGPAPEGAPAG
ncbi:MAG: sigma-70 family RNA polymerase sigma factor [Gemmatimonadota bacterium]